MMDSWADSLAGSLVDPLAGHKSRFLLLLSIAHSVEQGLVRTIAALTFHL
jgi:hypothetical protein